MFSRKNLENKKIRLEILKLKEEISSLRRARGPGRLAMASAMTALFVGLAGIGLTFVTAMIQYNTTSTANNREMERLLYERLSKATDRSIPIPARLAFILSFDDRWNTQYAPIVANAFGTMMAIESDETIIQQCALELSTALDKAEPDSQRETLRRVLFGSVNWDTDEYSEGIVCRYLKLANQATQQLNLQSILEHNGQRLQQCSFHDVGFHDMKFRDGHFEGSSFKDFVFSPCDFIDCHFEGAHLIIGHPSKSKMCIEASRLVGSNLSKAVLQNVSFLKSDLDSVNFTEAKMEVISFVESSLIGAKFCGDDLSRTHFINCDLTRADFSAAKMYDRLDAVNVNIKDVTGLGETDKKQLLAGWSGDGTAVVMESSTFESWLSAGKVRPTDPKELEHWQQDGFKVGPHHEAVFGDGSAPSSNKPESDK
jgi:uncharacterized protein YjbI with pentapeptide repeats